MSYSVIGRANFAGGEAIGLNGTGWVGTTTSDVMTEIDELGLVVIRGNKIDIYESHVEQPEKPRKPAY